MSPINITVNSVKRGLAALVSEAGPDFAYTPRDLGEREGCVYVYDGKPDCLVGQFLAGVGVPIERLQEADQGGFGDGYNAIQLIAALIGEGVVTVEPRVVDILIDAQGYQDIGHTWSKAVGTVLADYC